MRFWYFASFFVGSLLLSVLIYFARVSVFHWFGLFEVITEIVALVMSLAVAFSFISCRGNSSTDNIQAVANKVNGLMARKIWVVYKTLAFTVPGLFVASAVRDIRALGWGVHLILDAVKWFMVLTMDDN